MTTLHTARLRLTTNHCRHQLDQPLKPRLHDTDRLSNQLSNRFDNRLYRVYKHSTGCTTGLTTGWTNSRCSLTRFDNRLYRVNGVSVWTRLTMVSTQWPLLTSLLSEDAARMSQLSQTWISVWKTGTDPGLKGGGRQRVRGLKVP